jgi:hypothetical protein
MNKSQGTAMGAVLLAALLFRSGEPGVPSPRPNESQKLTQLTGKGVAGDGPWTASCKYWDSIKEAGEPDHQAPSIDLTLTESTNKTNSENDLKGSFTSPSQDGSECGSDENKKWGFPDPASQNLNVVAVIATMADPTHTNLGFQFDRGIDAIIEAAEANSFTSTYYWLPRLWTEQVQKTTKDSEDGHSEEYDNPEAHEPGLIIFRHFNPETPDEPSVVLYLFLVGETPTGGIDGLQIQRALHYESELKTVIDNQKNVENEHTITFARSFRDPDTLAIIGPTFSGSALPLQQAIESGLTRVLDVDSASVSGVTATNYADRVISSGFPHRVDYTSFEMESVLAEHTFADHVKDRHGNPSGIAILVEDGTTFGLAVEKGETNKRNDKSKDKVRGTIIHFPRGISMLRNAKMEQEGANRTGAAPAPSPYLHLSLKDVNIPDSVPHLSDRITPLSQESELMAIEREIQRERISYVVISSTNILDALFLAQFLHRAAPDARLVFENADQLFEREIDDEEYVGSLAMTAFPLTWVKTFPFPDSFSQEYYNAASYTFWDPSRSGMPHLNGIGYLPDTKSVAQLPLWLTTVGSDGYYPLGILTGNSADVSARVQPAHIWYFLCLFVSILCAAHTVLIWVADYWSPFTRDLDVRHNDQPSRRSMSIRIGTIMLFCMSFVVAWPLFACGDLIIHNSENIFTAIVTLLFGVVSLSVTLWKTKPYWRAPKKDPNAWFYRLFNVTALSTLIFVPWAWISLCEANWLAITGSKATLFFAYRCLNPASGVSPLVPVLLLLFSWYLWSVFQTLRLRFSKLNRPRLPKRLASVNAPSMFVADEDLSSCRKPRDICLFRNIGCLLITREVILRFCRGWQKRLADKVLIIGYIVFFVVLAVLLPFVQGMDHVLWKPLLGGPTLFELLIRALFFPLLVIALTGWLRMIFVWGSLKRGLLQRLETMPIRFAFDRMLDIGWVAMLRHSGLREQWRDMARSSESMRKIVNNVALMQRYNADITKNANTLVTTPGGPNRLVQIYNELNLDIAGLMSHYAGKQPGTMPPLLMLRQNRGIPPEELFSTFMNAIELHYADFAQELLHHLLIPNWTTNPRGAVQSKFDSPKLSTVLRESIGKLKEDGPSRPSAEEYLLQPAEEFVAIRYISLIRAVLVNLRYLITFVSAAFALGIIAWNSFPFEPHQLINWVFTILLAFLGTGVVWVFAQMHRDPILSRITNTVPNELGLDFYLRIVSFGAVPVLTWLAYNIPTIGAPLFQLLRPGVEVMK